MRRNGAGCEWKRISTQREGSRSERFCAASFSIAEQNALTEPSDLPCVGVGLALVEARVGVHHRQQQHRNCRGNQDHQRKVGKVDLVVALPVEGRPANRQLQAPESEEGNHALHRDGLQHVAVNVVAQLVRQHRLDLIVIAGRQQACLKSRSGACVPGPSERHWLSWSSPRASTHTRREPSLPLFRSSASAAPSALHRPGRGSGRTAETAAPARSAPAARSTA